MKCHDCNFWEQCKDLDPQLAGKGTCHYGVPLYVKAPNVPGDANACNRFVDKNLVNVQHVPVVVPKPTPAKDELRVGVEVIVGGNAT